MLEHVHVNSIRKRGQTLETDPILRCSITTNPSARPGGQAAAAAASSRITKLEGAKATETALPITSRSPPHSGTNAQPQLAKIGRVFYPLFRWFIVFFSLFLSLVDYLKFDSSGGPLAKKLGAILGHTARIQCQILPLKIVQKTHSRHTHARTHARSAGSREQITYKVYTV